jgi:transcriptional antiterminator RfaH
MIFKQKLFGDMEAATFNKGWYLLYTNSKQERNVAGQLDRMKIQHYLPLVKITRKWSDRLKILDSPLFPSYLFIYLNHFKEYFLCLEAQGALHFVRFGQQIAKVSDSVIIDLKIIVDAGEQIEVSFSAFQKGETVTITDGPLTGLKCEVIQYNKKEMILVRIELLQRNLLMELPVNHLCKL